MQLTDHIINYILLYSTSLSVRIVCTIITETIFYQCVNLQEMCMAALSGLALRIQYYNIEKIPLCAMLLLLDHYQLLL